MQRKGSDGGLVFSSEHGEMCATCAKPLAACTCKQVAPASKRGRVVVVVGRETKGRRGNGVTVISGVPLGSRQLAELASELKQRCASGGTVRGGVIEIQGDHRDRLVAELGKRGWIVKRSGR